MKKKDVTFKTTANGLPSLLAALACGAQFNIAKVGTTVVATVVLQEKSGIEKFLEASRFIRDAYKNQKKITVISAEEIMPLSAGYYIAKGLSLNVFSSAVQPYREAKGKQ